MFFRDKLYFFGDKIYFFSNKISVNSVFPFRNKDYFHFVKGVFTIRKQTVYGFLVSGKTSKTLLYI